jgi:hypothetical protein
MSHTDHNHDADHDDVATSGHPDAVRLGFEPDHQPMKAVTVMIVVVSLLVIGTGFGLANLLGVVSREHRASLLKDTVEPRLKATLENSAALLSSSGVDPDSKLVRVPVTSAVQYLVANPGMVATAAVFPGLPAQNDPKAPDAPPAGAKPAAPAAAPAGPK